MQVEEGRKTGGSIREAAAQAGGDAWSGEGRGRHAPHPCPPPEAEESASGAHFLY